MRCNSAHKPGGEPYALYCELEEGHPGWCSKYGITWNPPLVPAAQPQVVGDVQPIVVGSLVWRLHDDDRALLERVANLLETINNRR